MIEGDYETYQRLAQQEAEAAQAKAATAGREALVDKTGVRRGQGFEKRKAASSPTARPPTSSRSEIGEAGEATVAEPRRPARPARPLGATRSRRRATQQQHDDIKAQLSRLYEHWEEALEWNS